MTHAEFLSGYQAGRLRVDIDRKAAIRFVAGRLMLPLVLLPIFGIAVATGLMRAYAWAIAFLVLGFGLRLAVAAASPGFILQKSLTDATFFDEVRKAGILFVAPV
ncbi:MAG: hypothetical protein JNM79_17665 [Burkholderiales bacterium]|nr:hypothetical protein [Burkholderiales bacterium]